MSFYNFIYYKSKSFDEKQILSLLSEINNTRFDDKLIIEKGKKIKIKHPKILDWIQISNIKDRTDIKIIFQLTDDNWLNYVEMVFRNELALKLKGTVQVGENKPTEPMLKLAGSKTYDEFCRRKFQSFALYTKLNLSSFEEQENAYVYGEMQSVPEDMKKY